MTRPAQGRRPPVVQTASGWLAGEWAAPRDEGAWVGSGGEGERPGREVAVFRGVPFAAPPVGPARWRPPSPPASWPGVRPATAFGPAPVQPQPRRDSVMFAANFADRRALIMSEDCLYLNVWTPDPSAGARLGVLVWVHGGGNRFGYGSQDIHDGARLARRGIVVVTLNYRLGALGFLVHPEFRREQPDGSAGNWALHDVLAALRWVQASIGAFGGDPAQVTLAGNSAGAAIACHLMAAPAARGLFSRVIGASSAGLCRPDGPMPSVAAAAAAGTAFAAGLGAADLAALRGMSAAELCVSGHFGPVVDGSVLPADTQDVFLKGDQADVPLLVGSNTDEGANFAQAGAGADLAARTARCPAGSVFHAAYPAGSPRERQESARRLVGETRFVWPVWRWAVLHATTANAPVWMYRFGGRPPLPDGLAPPPDGGDGYGAFHSAELTYAWDNLAQRAWDWTDADRELAGVVSSGWSRFVAAGDPNGAGLPGWAPFSGIDDPEVMYFANPDAGGPVAWTGPMDRLAAMHALDEQHAAGRTGG